jgi:MFS family permease
MILWGTGMGAQGSLLQAMLTGVIPAKKRVTAFGLFDTGYGIAWFLGSAAMGLLYDKSILAVALVSVLLQLSALPVLFVANKNARFFNGSVRETRRTKSRRAAAKDFSFTAFGRETDATRATGGEASGRG